MSEKKELVRDIIRIYFQNGSSATQLVRTYHTEKQLKVRTFDESKVRRIIKKFNEGNVLIERRSGSGRPSLFPSGDSVITEIAKNQMESNPHGLTSIRNIAKSAGVSVGTAFNYMKSLEYKPYKPRRVQELLPNDYQQRCDFADKAMRQLDFESVLWTDEAYFSLDGNIFSLRGSVWSDVPTSVLMEKPLHSKKVLVWCGFCSRFAVDPFFFNGTLTGVEYLSMLKEHVELFFRRKRCITTITFQQDGAPPHINNEVKQYLQQRFSGGRVLSRHFEFNWPPRSPDITPMDYFFWGYIKQKVYGDQKFKTLEELKCKIIQVVQNLSSDLLKSVCESVPRRLEALIANNGGHIEKFGSFS